MIKKIELSVLIVLIMSGFSACKFDLPTSSDFSEDRNNNDAVKTAWDPYVGVHPFAYDAGLQQPHLTKLIQAGVLRGVRLGGLDNPEIQRFANWFQDRRVEVLGILDNKYLRNPNVCQIFSQHVVQNPGVIVWELGNEVSGFIGMLPEEYMEIASRLFYYVKQKHPQISLAIGAVAGNGSSADDLRRMIDAGLNKLCQDGLEIVPIHFYSWQSPRLQEFKSQVARLPISTKIWITETNDMPGDWNTQIGYVQDMYPKLRSSLRAERIYWYVFSEYSEFSLVKADSWEYSPLMNALIGINQAVESSSFAPEPFSDMYPEPHYPGEKRDRNKEKQKEKRQQ